jgi:hypothetical protein
MMVHRKVCAIPACYSNIWKHLHKVVNKQYLYHFTKTAFVQLTKVSTVTQNDELSCLSLRNQIFALSGLCRHFRGRDALVLPPDCLAKT